MKYIKKEILSKLFNLAESSEEKYKRGDFKGAIDDKRKIKSILNSDSCDDSIREKYKEKLSSLYISKFDLIYDYKVRIKKQKRDQIIFLLERKSDEKYKEGDYKASIKALRRAEKYQ